MSQHQHIIIIGGGITGMSTAWYLQQQAQVPIRITLVEAGTKLGGKMTTKTIKTGNGHQFIIDGGAESFVTRKPEAWNLALELGLEDQVINPGSETRDMYVLDKGRPVRIPLDPISFIRSDLISIGGKLRMIQEPFLPRRTDMEDESLADFVTRRLGREALDKMIGPVLAGIYNTDPETQSIMTTSPIMREMERDYGGLFKGAFGRMLHKRKRSKLTDPDEPKPPSFMTFHDGAQVLIDSIQQQLDAEFILGQPVSSITSENGQYQVLLGDSGTINADAVVLALPANQTATILAETAPDSVKLLQTIRHASIGTITLIYKQGDIDLPYPVNGLMIPRREKRKIDAVTWTSAKPMPRAPEGYEMVRVFFGGSSPDVAKLPDADLELTVLRELKDIFGLEAVPVNSVIFRWLDSFPLADVGHLDLVDRIEETIPDRLALAGSSYRGIGIPDCIRQGKQAAVKIIKDLS